MAEEKHLTLTYLNIRQSIAILISKLVLIDFILAGIIISFYYFLVLSDQYTTSGLSRNIAIFLSAFIIIGVFKIFLTIFVVLKWLNEYYEITPEYIVHKHGLIFKKQEQYRIDHTRRIIVQDSFLGELLNYGTITLYDMRLNKCLDLYLIHNARRYAKVLKELSPNLEMRQDKVWLPFREEEELAPTEKKE